MVGALADFAFRARGLMVTKEERALARRFFKCDCIMANANVFQDLFWAVMKAKHGQSFEEVGPQGRKGDGGNDGYLPDEGHYFQLYAPIDPKEKAAAAARKLSTDFATIVQQWGVLNERGIAKFTFVYNDKYLGTPKDISMALERLRAAHQGVTFASCGAADVETEFMNLPDGEWDRVLGTSVPDPDRIVSLDYSVLGEVIRHILSCEVDEEETRIVVPPSLDQKIGLNNLAQIHAIRIRNGSLYIGHIKRYLSSNSNFASEDLRDRVVGVFEAAKQAVAASPLESEPVVDAVFKVFRRGLFPRRSVVGASTAVDAVIGCFFEACDVFDPAPESRGLPGATP